MSLMLLFDDMWKLLSINFCINLFAVCFCQSQMTPTAQNKPDKKPTPKSQVTYSFMLHLDSPCFGAAAPQFRLTAPSAVLALGLFQGETGISSKLSF